MSDVPVGVLLSGGLDSTTLLALIRERSSSLSTFSVGFVGGGPVDERAEARRVARHFGTDHHEIAVSERDALAFLPGLIHHQDEPLADPVCIPLHFVCGHARERGVKVVLAGEGADELFWGYPRYQDLLRRWSALRALLALPAPVRSLLPRVIAVGGRRRRYRRELLDQITRGRLAPAHVPAGATSHERARLLRRPHDALAWSPSDGERGAAADPLSAFAFDTQEHEFGLRLPELLLMRIDRFSMANGVEARVPFLAPDLVEFVYRLPLEAKLHGGVSKVVLRQAVGHLLPDHVLARPKQGFGAPIQEWLGSRMDRLLARLLAGDALRCYFDTDAISELLARHARGARNQAVLWPVLNFGLWHRYWIEGEPLEPLLEPLGDVT